MRQYISKCKGMIPTARRDSRGITGLETAIVLIAFVVVSSVFAFAALSTGLFSADKSKETINAGLSEARGTLELRGAVIVEASTTGDSGIVSQMKFQVANAAGGESVDLTPGETLIKYTDNSQSRMFSNTGTYVFTVAGVGNADVDNLVEQGEIYEVTLTNLANLTGDLSTDTVFTLELIPPQGAIVHIERTTPVRLETYNDVG